MAGLFAALEDAGIDPTTGEIINETIHVDDDFEVSRDDLEEHIVYAAVCEEVILGLTDAYDAIDGMGANPCIESLHLIKDAARNTLRMAGLSNKVCVRLIPSTEGFATENVLFTVADVMKRAIKALIDYLIEMGGKVKTFIVRVVTRRKNLEKEIEKTITTSKDAVKEGKKNVVFAYTDSHLTVIDRAIMNTPVTQFTEELGKLSDAMSSVFSAMKDNQQSIEHALVKLNKGELAEEIDLNIFFQDTLGNSNNVKHGRLPINEAVMGVIPNLPFGHEFVYNIPVAPRPTLSDLPHYNVRIRLNAEYEEAMNIAFDKKEYSDITLSISEFVKTAEALKKLNDKMKFETLDPHKITDQVLSIARGIKTNDFDRRNNLSINVMRAAAHFLTTEYFVWSDYYTSITTSMNKLLNRVTWEA